MRILGSTFKKLSLIRLKLAAWGFKGVVDWFIHRGRTRRERRFFLENAKQHPYSKPEKGITIVGPLSSFDSLPKALRDFALCLKDAGIPFQALDTEHGGLVSESGAIATSPDDFRVGRFSHSVELVSSRIPDGIVSKRAIIMFWEFNEGLCEGYPCLLDNDDDLIAMSDFNYEYFQRTFGPKRKVHKIPYPLRIDVSGVPGKDACRAKFGFSPDDFIVFFNFNYNSGFQRKNPAGVVKAFASALRSEPNARLAFKTLGRERCPAREDELLRLAESEGVRDRLVLFNDGMPQEAVYELTNACDVYCSLHRAEGFGLGIAEAMSLSKPVVATDYSATKEFCRPEHCILVPCQMSKVPPSEMADMPSYRWCRTWADPDIHAAARALRRLYDDTSLRERLGNDARRFIENTYNTVKFRMAVESFLNR